MVIILIVLAMAILTAPLWIVAPAGLFLYSMFAMVIGGVLMEKRDPTVALGVLLSIPVVWSLAGYVHLIGGGS